MTALRRHPKRPSRIREDAFRAAQARRSGDYGTRPDLELVTGPVEVELQIFKERVEFLLRPEYADHVLP